MFKILRNKIIIITMTATTAVLLVAGGSIMLFSSTLRPEPKPFMEFGRMMPPDFEINIEELDVSDQEINYFIKVDRKEGSSRLLVTLLSVGLFIEVVVFWATFYFSKRIVEPVKDAYDKQKLFIANASHELKTPLAVIQANMEALDVDAENEKWKDNIETEITHANKLVLNLLQLAKMDAGDMQKSEPENFDLNAEIKKRVEIFKPKFGGKISFKPGEKTLEKNLRKQDLLQVLDILLDNATKYGEKKIEISADVHEIMVKNDGTVIDKKDAEKIFDRFYQTDKTKEGSGLGLAIAKAICEQNGWSIVATGEDGMTKFQIRFRND